MSQYPGIPRTVRIGHEQWTIRVEGKKENKEFRNHRKVMGYTMEDGRCEIFIRKGLAPSYARSTLFHELLHAIRFNRSNLLTPPDFNDEEWKPDDVFDAWEHLFIKMYQNSVIDLLRDNPELLRYLTQEDENL